MTDCRADKWLSAFLSHRDGATHATYGEGIRPTLNPMAPGTCILPSLREPLPSLLPVLLVYTAFLLFLFWGRNFHKSCLSPWGAATLCSAEAEQSTRRASSKEGGKASPTCRGTLLNAPRCFPQGDCGFLPIRSQCIWSPKVC